LEISASSAGYVELLLWARSLGESAFAVEGSGSYGAGLARALATEGVEVFEVERPQRSERRRGKSDPLDADRAARRLLAGEGLSRLRGAGERETLRALLLERRSAAEARVVALNQLQALLVTAPAAVRERLQAKRGGEQLAQACAGLRRRPSEPENEAITEVLRRLATRSQRLADELALIDQTLQRIVAELAPELLAECGVGPFCAAQLLVSAGDPRRLRSDAAFARLGGVSPLPASSGRTQRHRLNRSGDRQLNYAFHLIALHRARHHDETRAYQQRLLDRGKTKREARRCIKRALARRFYRLLIANEKLHYATT
jgi:transposase